MSADNKLLDEITIGKNVGHSVYNLAWQPQKQKFYLITGQYAFPDYSYSWLQQPLLQLEGRDVQEVKQFFGNEKQTALRSEPGQPFTTVMPNGTSRNIDISELLRQFNYLSFEEVASAQNFDETLYPESKEIQLATFDGMVVNITLLRHQEKYWLKLNLSSTRLPTTQVSDYIEGNAFLYDGWFFKINSDTGRIMFNYMF